MFQLVLEDVTLTKRDQTRVEKNMIWLKKKLRVLENLH